MKKRIVKFTLDEPIDRRILLQAESLSEAGYEVIIVAPNPPKQWGKVAFYDINTDTDICDLKQPPSKIFGAGYKLTQWLHRHGINPKFIKGLYWRWFDRLDRRFIRQFETAIREIRGDIYVAHDLPLLPVAGDAVKRYGGKLVYDSHEFFSEQEFGWLEKTNWRNLEGSLISKADLVITINKGISEIIADRYGVAPPIVIMNCERDYQRDDAKLQTMRASYGFAPEHKLVLFQGFLMRHRNIDTLIKAMPLINDDNIVLVILGRGPDTQRLKAIAERLGLETRVRFLDYVPQDKLLDHTALADAGIIPYQPTSLNSLHCTPNKLFEFAVVKVPVIASPLPQIEAILLQHGIGLTGNLGTPETTARLIEHFFSNFKTDPELQHRLDIAAEVLSWKQESPKLLTAYAELSAPH